MYNFIASIEVSAPSAASANQTALLWLLYLLTELNIPDVNELPDCKICLLATPLEKVAEELRVWRKTCIYHKPKLSDIIPSQKLIEVTARIKACWRQSCIRLVPILKPSSTVLPESAR